jgi:hypothetical protein
MGDSLTEKLLETREGYEDELEWHKFLLDAYAGTGGFAGRVKQPDEDRLGWGASAYDTCCSTTNTTVTSTQQYPDATLVPTTSVRTYTTYLDAFPREDDAKFRRRIDIAHYVNYTGPICDLYAGYLSSVDPSREGVDDEGELSEWMQDCDGRGTSWDELKETVLIPCALDLGWCPVVFDQDSAPDDAAPRSRLDEQKLQLGTRAVPLTPANILKWETDDGGTLKWVKYRVDYCEQEDPLGESVEYSKFWIWTRADVSVYRIDKGSTQAQVIVENRAHSFGAVPMVVFRASKSPGDPVRGMSAIAAVAIENRRHFNLMSELDEHLRSTVFALLQVPVPPGVAPPETLVMGNGNAVPVPSDASQGYGFIAPPQSVADTYEARLAASAREIYRVAQAPYEVDSGAPTSGIAYAYKFEGTNKRLVKIAKGLASAEQRALQLVGRSLGMSDENVDAIRVEAPAGFLVNDISVDLDNLIKAIGLQGMAATAKMIAISRAVQKMLPNMRAEDRAKIEEELEALRDKELAASEQPEPDPPVPPNGEPPADGDEPEDDDDAPPNADDEDQDEAA